MQHEMQEEENDDFSQVGKSHKHLEIYLQILEVEMRIEDALRETHVDERGVDANHGEKYVHQYNHE